TNFGLLAAMPTRLYETPPFPVARSAMRNRLRALSAVVIAGIALAVPAQMAYADSMEELTVAHRGASTSKLAEGTLPA
ncbi:MAG TPA: hypothetical protein VJ625_11460, partial [Propionibacteriaceae bacterium]|nr:hypothetical protein [Propionibacteriaceae bacterium]